MPTYEQLLADVGISHEDAVELLKKLIGDRELAELRLKLAAAQKERDAKQAEINQPVADLEKEIAVKIDAINAAGK